MVQMTREERIQNEVEKALEREELLGEADKLRRKANANANDFQDREYSLTLRQIKWGIVIVAGLVSIATRQFLAIRQ